MGLWLTFLRGSQCFQSICPCKNNWCCFLCMICHHKLMFLLILLWFSSPHSWWKVFKNAYILSCTILWIKHYSQMCQSDTNLKHNYVTFGSPSMRRINNSQITTVQTGKNTNLQLMSVEELQCIWAASGSTRTARKIVNFHLKLHSKQITEITHPIAVAYQIVLRLSLYNYHHMG